MNDSCEGCLSYSCETEKCRADIVEVGLKDTGNCPCSECLVKFMCNNACYSFRYARRRQQDKGE